MRVSGQRLGCVTGAKPLAKPPHGKIVFFFGFAGRTIELTFRHVTEKTMINICQCVVPWYTDLFDELLNVKLVIALAYRVVQWKTREANRLYISRFSQRTAGFLETETETERTAGVFVWS